MVVGEKLISAAEFWELEQSPDFADKSLELKAGIIIATPLPSAQHGLNTGEICYRIHQHVDQHDLGYVTVESGYVLFKSPDGRDTVRGPDVAFVAKERLPHGLPEDYIPFAPDLAVEVVSPNDKVYDVEEKIDEYLRAGTKLIWVISPRLKIVTAYTQAAITVHDLHGTLDGGAVLPGFTLPVAAIFHR